MYLRELKIEDAPLMLEWMHDENVISNLRGNFSKKTIDDCETFVGTSISESNIHLAIASDTDDCTSLLIGSEYTISVLTVSTT